MFSVDCFQFTDIDLLAAPSSSGYTNAFRTNGHWQRPSQDVHRTEGDRNSAVVYNNRGISHRHDEEYDTAIADYTAAIALNPEYAKAYNNRGNAYRALGDLDAAIADYNRAIQLNPQDPVVYGNRSIAYGTLGDLEAAIADCTIVIELQPGDALAFFNRAVSYQAIGSELDAIADFCTAAELFLQRGDTVSYQRTLDLLDEVYQHVCA